jgi:hypothetical protein
MSNIQIFENESGTAPSRQHELTELVREIRGKGLGIVNGFTTVRMEQVREINEMVDSYANARGLDPMEIRSELFGLAARTADQVVEHRAIEARNEGGGFFSRMVPGFLK